MTSLIIICVALYLHLGQWVVLATIGEATSFNRSGWSVYLLLVASWPMWLVMVFICWLEDGVKHL